MAQVDLYTPIEMPRLVRRSAGIAFATASLNTALDELYFVGQVYLENPTGGAKTISSAGGKIHWSSGTLVTFANAATTLDISIQDVSTTSGPAQGDGVADVSAQLVGGTDVLTANADFSTTMETGSKTLTHGQLIAVSFKMSALGGADVVSLSFVIGDSSGTGLSGRMHVPSCTFREAGGAPTQLQGRFPNVGIEFDDGTIGWLIGGEGVAASATQSFAVDSATADEYGNFIQLPFDAKVNGVTVAMSIAALTSDFEVVLYSDPLGTPAVIASASVDAHTFGDITSIGNVSVMFSSPVALSRNTAYAVSIRPTTTNAVGLTHYTRWVAKFNKMNGLGDNCYSIRRIDNAGAFSDFNGGIAKSRMMSIALLIQGVDDGTGSGVGSGGMVYVQS